MSTLIKKISKASSGDKVYIIQNIKDLPKGDFDKNQLEHIKKQLDDGKKTIAINHYGSYSFLVKPDEKKTRSLTLEACRVAGNSMLSSINGNGISEIQIIDSGKLPIETLCFAEGMLLVNLQCSNRIHQC
jgi:hypothetical protein